MAKGAKTQPLNRAVQRALMHRRFACYEPHDRSGEDGLTTGQEWLIDASGCDADVLRDPVALAALFEALIVELGLKVLGTPQWHTFPGPGGVTGLALLSESHLAIHTFPEHGFAALNLYSCRTRPCPDFSAFLHAHLRAAHVDVRELHRGGVR